MDAAASSAACSAVVEDMARHTELPVTPGCSLGAIELLIPKPPAHDDLLACSAMPCGRSAIFSDDADSSKDDETGGGFEQVFSTDATATAIGTTIQPSAGATKRPRCVHSEPHSRQRPPLRARRVLNLMDRLDAEDAPTTAVKSATSGSLGKRDAPERDSQSDGAGGVQVLSHATVSSDEMAISECRGDEDGDTLVIRRKWKRRLAENATEAADASQLSLSQTLVPSIDEAEPRRPAFSRSLSSHSVFLARPKMTVRGVDGDRTTASMMHELTLPTVRSSSHPDLNVISPQTVAELINGNYSEQLDSFSLIDCRFEYEYEGGSLKGSVSMNSPAKVEEAFLHNPPKNSTRIALIFYCEFSAKRAPKMLRHIRNLDRWIHAERYPELFYPELYLIDGGYKNCFESMKDVICHPSQYRTMSDKAFVAQCKQGFALHRANWKHHKSTSCASKFQHLHRRIHDGVGDCADDDETVSTVDNDDLFAHPLNLRSFSQQL